MRGDLDLDPGVDLDEEVVRVLHDPLVGERVSADVGMWREVDSQAIPVRPTA
jgi:hypothetical protein